MAVTTATRSRWVAAYRGNEAVVKLLIEHKADVNTRGVYYGNVLQAASRDNEAVVKLFIVAPSDAKFAG